MGKENHTMGESREYMTLPEENGSINISEEVIAAIAVGAVRDVEELRARGWPVFAAAVVPCAADSDGPGQLNHPISCGGVPVHPGDIILADDNGGAVIPPTWAEWVLEGCE